MRSSRAHHSAGGDVYERTASGGLRLTCTPSMSQIGKMENREREGYVK